MSRPTLSAMTELLKPITWFPPMWAFGCGVVASGMPLAGRLPLIVAGVLLAGPFVCATSQAVNDWFDRDVDRDQRAAASDSVGTDAGSLGAVHRDRVDVAFGAAGRQPRPRRVRGRGVRARARLGLQRATGAPQAQRLVGQQRLCALLRRPRLADGLGGHGLWARGPSRVVLRSRCSTASERTAS